MLFCGIGGADFIFIFQVPVVDIFDVLLRFPEGDTAGAFDVSGACVVAREDEVDVAVVAVGESSQIARTAEDILSWVEGIADFHMFGGSGHELHKSHGARAADGGGIKVAFNFNDGADERGGDIVLFGGLVDERVVLVRAVGCG